MKHALRCPVPGCQVMWKDLGKCLGRLSPPIAWDFTPEQANNPDKLMRHLIEGCLAYSSENQQLLALYWGLTCAYQATIQFYQRTMVKTGIQTTSENAMIEPEIQTTSENVMVETETQTTSEDTMIEIGTQTLTTISIPSNRNHSMILSFYDFSIVLSPVETYLFPFLVTFGVDSRDRIGIVYDCGRLSGDSPLILVYQLLLTPNLKS